MWSSNEKRTYLAAFTVQELLVAMVIGSLIMGMIYVIYVRLNKQLYAYGDYGQEQMEYNQFKHIWASDLFHARSVEKYGANALMVIFKEGGTHTYRFEGDKVVRERSDSLRDTFAIAVTTFGMEENDTYLALRLETRLGGVPITIFEAKEIPRADQINKIYGHGH